MSDFQYVRTVHLQIGTLPLLLALLKSCQPAVEEQATGAVSSLIASPQHIHEAITADAAQLLAVSSRSDQPKMQGKAGGALQLFAAGCGCVHDAIHAAGAVLILVA